jgi:hypothetical protein
MILANESFFTPAFLAASPPDIPHAKVLSLCGNRVLKDFAAIHNTFPSGKTPHATEKSIVTHEKFGDAPNTGAVYITKPGASDAYAAHLVADDDANYIPAIVIDSTAIDSEELTIAIRVVHGGDRTRIRLPRGTGANEKLYPVDLAANPYKFGGGRDLEIRIDQNSDNTTHEINAYLSVLRL